MNWKIIPITTLVTWLLALIILVQVNKHVEANNSTNSILLISDDWNGVNSRSIYASCVKSMGRVSISTECS